LTQEMGFAVALFAHADHEHEIDQEMSGQTDVAGPLRRAVRADERLARLGRLAQFLERPAEHPASLGGEWRMVDRSLGAEHGARAVGSDLWPPSLALQLSAVRLALELGQTGTPERIRRRRGAGEESRRIHARGKRLQIGDELDRIVHE